MSYNLLRTCFVQGTRPTTSTARIPVAASLHTTAPAHAESARRRQARLTRQANLEKRVKIEERAAAERPHVVLGTRPGDEAKWTQCDLARVLVKPEELAPIPLDAAPVEGHEVLHTLESVGGGPVTLPKTFAYGITEPEKRLLFEHLPVGNAETRSRVEHAKYPMDTFDFAGAMKRNISTSVVQANMLARIVDLSNANKGGIMYENRRRVIKEFSDGGKENDTGRPEVQAALLTIQIRNLWEHLTKFKRDVGNRRSLRKLVHKRAKILRYLKSYDRDRYDRVLERLGLEPESVEGELVV
ncbi:S15/NS1 RNA-binding domain-containing protein [Dentipellis sp. KUC8613]|nr:S15/NS1 RNA-binding domain-containing protein [Dentipellis sp. KUC8613]